MKQIGTVEVLRARVYPLDAALGHDPLATTVVVEPGEFNLWQDGMSTWFMLRGRINVGLYKRLGDGVFTMGAADRPGAVEVVFPSKVFGPDEWIDFIAEATCQEGHDDQRLRITLNEGISA